MSTSPISAPTAAILVIGNELLTGKIRDQNVEVLAKELFSLGIALRRVIFCGDEVEAIAGDLNLLRADFDHIFTSGGVGPTHDDVTLPAVARAFDRPLVRHPEIVMLLREFFGSRLTEDHLRMADLPAGAVLVRVPQVKWPTVRIDNVFVLPGLPEVFRMKMSILREHLRGGRPFVSRAIELEHDEGEIAARLRQVAELYPQVAIGSYPRWDDGPMRVTITFDGLEARDVEAAMARLREALAGDELGRSVPR